MKMAGIGLLRALPTALALALIGGSCGGGPSAPDNPLIRFGISTRALVFGPTDSQRTIRLENRGDGPAPWQAQPSAAWIEVLPVGGALPVGETEVVVRLDRLSLTAGTHVGEVRFFLDGAPLPVAVTAEHAGRAVPDLQPTSAALGPDDPAASFTLHNRGEVQLSWSVGDFPAWLGILPAAGTVAPGDSTTLTLTPDRTDLDDGTYDARITIDSSGGAIAIALTVSVSSPAKARFQPGSVDFGLTRTAFTISLHNDGGRDLTWTAAADDPWVTFSPSSGTLKPKAMKPIALSVTRDGLAGGEHQTAVRLTSNGGSAALVVKLEVQGPPPPPPPPPPGEIALEGRVTDQFSGTGLAGLTVEFDGIAAVTDATGAFSVPGIVSNELRDLEMSGGSIHARRTFARSSDDGWEAIPSSFDMSAFNDLAREYEPRTIRWVDTPAVYIDTTPYGFPGPVPPEWIAEVQSAVAGIVDDWSNGEIAPGSVTVGNSPPPEGAAGTLVIQFDEDAERYPSEQTVGLARTFWSATRAISSARIWLRFGVLPQDPTVRRAIFAHEVGHTMGMGHMNGGTSSLMTPVVTVPDLTTFDRRAGDVVYGRSPGNSSPDTDSAATYIGRLAPAGRPIGQYEWVCGDPAMGSPETTPPLP